MKQILCFGDSNTWGYMPESKERYPWGVRWTSLLQQYFENQDIRIIEDGIVGRTTSFDDPVRPYRNGVKELPRSLEANDGLDAVVLMLGTNDCKAAYNADAGRIAAGIETLIRQIRQNDANTKILLMSPIHLGTEVWRESYDPEFDRFSVEVSKELESEYRMLAHKYEIAFLAASDYAKPSDRDMEHMDEEGHKNLSMAVYGKLSELLDDHKEMAA
ncbi:MAG: GDSL-type esterase/lipase family protein [Eubacteriales bacterium]|nr:GDSL-type esterase/lipase family protein [Eubacteriales bacterium]